MNESNISLWETPVRLLLLLGLMTIAAVARAETSVGDAAAGHALAMQSCAVCHIVAEQQPPPITFGAPSFFAVAADPAVTALGLRVFLQTPHDRMPNLILKSSEIGDVASYIMSLRGKPAPLPPVLQVPTPPPPRPFRPKDKPS